MSDIGILCLFLYPFSGAVWETWLSLFFVFWTLHPCSAALSQSALAWLLLRIGIIDYILIRYLVKMALQVIAGESSELDKRAKIWAN